MTNREFFTAVANGTINDEVIAHAAGAITKMDDALLAKKNKPSKRAIENAPLKEKIISSILSYDTPTTAKRVAEVLEISTQKASSLLRSLVNEGAAAAEDIKVEGKSCKAYCLLAD